MITRMDRIKLLIKEKEQVKAAIDKEIVELKVELADIILRADEKDAEPAENKSMIRFVGVVFKSGGVVYDYIWNGPGVPAIGDTVQVESKWNSWTEVEVVNVFQKPADQCDDKDYKCAYPAK